MKEFDNGLQEKWDFDLDAPSETEVSIGKLKKFLKPSDTLIFYGGEPLLQIEKIKEIMDNVDARFCMQTNGKLLDKLPPEYVNKISKILVSIDGSRERTDFNKGEGTYDLVLKNLKLIRSRGFEGEIVARMVISQEFPDVFEQVKHLAELALNGHTLSGHENNQELREPLQGLQAGDSGEPGVFDSVHWQLDAGFYKFDFDEEKFSEFVERYNNSILKLIEYWIAQMENGEVLRLYPFVAIMDSLLKNEDSKLRCGSGHTNYTITTNGNLVACPIMGCVKNFYCGNLESEKLKQIFVGEPCVSCDYLKICGGRCLYSNQAKLWPHEGEELICKSVKHLIDELSRGLPSVKNLIKKGKISEKDFEYEKYFGPEIIP